MFNDFLFIIKKLLKSFLRHRIYVSFTPTSYIPSVRFNLSFFSFFIIFIFFIFILSFSLFNIFSYTDYYALKIENILLKYKIAGMIKSAEEGLSYLASVKKAEKQLAEISFSGRGYQTTEFIGGPTSAEFFRFTKFVNRIDYSRLNEKEIVDAYRKIKSESEQRIKDFDKLFRYVTSQVSRMNSTPKGWPVGGYISSPFGYRVHPFTFSYDFHSGVDIVNNPGSDISVTADGVVRYTGWALGYGLCVIVDHGFGYTTLYGHLSQVTVKVGDVIKKGSIIGKLGSTGTSTGPHLHYEVWEYGVPKNPIKYINFTENSN